MGLIFRREHIDLILNGVKTQTRRQHRRPLRVGGIYQVKKDWYHSTDLRIRITRAYRQRLGDISYEEAHREGGYTVDEFKEIWCDINGSWDPDTIVWVYEFYLLFEARLIPSTL